MSEDVKAALAVILLVAILVLFIYASVTSIIQFERKDTACETVGCHYVETVQGNTICYCFDDGNVAIIMLEGRGE